MSSLDEISSFINAQTSKTTVYNEKTAMNQLERFKKSSVYKDHQIIKMKSYDLNMLLCQFYMHSRKSDGTEYEPDSLSTFSRSIQRFLNKNNYKLNILTDKNFAKSREVLASKRKQLKKLGYGNKPNSTREITEFEIQKLYDEKYFGMTSPSSVQRTVWWFISLHFGFRGRDEARQLAWGDVQLEHDISRGLDFLVWHKERTRKRSTGKENANVLESGRMYETRDSKCPIHMYRQFANHRPADALKPESPFFSV